MTAISVSERLLEMAAFYTPLALTVTSLFLSVLVAPAWGTTKYDNTFKPDK